MDDYRESYCKYCGEPATLCQGECEPRGYDTSYWADCDECDELWDDCQCDDRDEEAEEDGTQRTPEEV